MDHGGEITTSAPFNQTALESTVLNGLTLFLVSFILYTITIVFYCELVFDLSYTLTRMKLSLSLVLVNLLKSTLMFHKSSPRSSLRGFTSMMTSSTLLLLYDITLLFILKLFKLLMMIVQDYSWANRNRENTTYTYRGKNSLEVTWQANAYPALRFTCTGGCFDNAAKEYLTLEFYFMSPTGSTGTNGITISIFKLYSVVILCHLPLFLIT